MRSSRFLFRVSLLELISFISTSSASNRDWGQRSTTHRQYVLVQVYLIIAIMYVPQGLSSSEGPVPPHCLLVVAQCRPWSAQLPGTLLRTEGDSVTLRCGEAEVTGHSLRRRSMSSHLRTSLMNFLWKALTSGFSWRGGEREVSPCSSWPTTNQHDLCTHRHVSLAGQTLSRLVY